MANSYQISRSNILVLKEGKTIQDFIDLNRKLIDNEIELKSGEMYIESEGNCLCENYSDKSVHNKKFNSLGLDGSRCFVLFDCDFHVEYYADYLLSDVVTEYVTLLESIMEPNQIIYIKGSIHEKRRYVDIYQEILDMNSKTFITSYINDDIHNLKSFLNNDGWWIDDSFGIVDFEKIDENFRNSKYYEINSCVSY